jgi:peptide deformylase
MSDTEIEDGISKAMPILIYPDPILHELSEKVDEVNDEIRILIHNLFITMYSEGGVGLSAIQCGIKKRVFVMDVSTLVTNVKLSLIQQLYLIRMYNVFRRVA